MLSDGVRASNPPHLPCPRPCPLAHMLTMYRVCFFADGGPEGVQQPQQQQQQQRRGRRRRRPGHPRLPAARIVPQIVPRIAPRTVPRIVPVPMPVHVLVHVHASRRRPSRRGHPRRRHPTHRAATRPAATRDAACHSSPPPNDIIPPGPLIYVSNRSGGGLYWPDAGVDFLIHLKTCSTNLRRGVVLTTFRPLWSGRRLTR